MAPSIVSNRWKVSEADFATRVAIPDLKGYFDNLPLLGGAPKSRSIVIEPGTRSVIIEDGVVLGDLFAGEYTLQSLTERLQFWRNKQATVFLTRGEDFPIESRLLNLPCLEGICFDLTYRWMIQMKDVLLFMDNLMGAHESISTGTLQELLAPVLQQAVRDAVGQIAYDTLQRGDFLNLLADGIRSRVDVKFSRYGLAFVDLHSAVAVAQDGGISERRGENWLKRREVELQRAAGEIDNEQLRANSEEIRKKVNLRVGLRSLVTEDNLNQIKNREDFEKAILEIDRDRLMRREERDAMVAVYEDRKDDREQLRNHLLAVIDIHREQELDELRLAMDHTVRMKSLSQEIEQSQLSRTLDNDKWRSELEREREEAEHRWQQRHQRVRARWDRIREARRQGREDNLEEVVQAQRVEGIQGELELARADRHRQLAIVQAELENRLSTEKLEVQKRQELWEIEVREKKSSSQLDRLQRVQEMNFEFTERQSRLQLEMENLKADRASQRELERMRLMSTVSTEVLIAMAGEANASLLADLRKHEASQEALKVQAASSPAAELNAERLKMYEQMNATERAKAEAIAEAYKLAMQAQQASVHQMIGGLAHAATPVTYGQPGFPNTSQHASPPSLTYPPQTNTADLWYFSLHGQPSQPLSRSQLKQAIETGQVTASTLVWTHGMTAWAPAAQIQVLADCFRTSATIPMSGPPGPPPM